MRISDWSSDVCSEYLYDRALDRLAATAEIVELDITPLLEAARLLYGGPWVAERTAAIAGLLARDPDAIDATVRAIVEPGNAMSAVRSEEHTSELQSLMRISYAVFCLKKK